MAKLVSEALAKRAGRVSSGGAGARRLRKLLAILTLLCVLTFSTVGLAQSSRRGSAVREEEPPRQMQKANPWPWLAAFLLLAFAWYPAFKSSKREMGG